MCLDQPQAPVCRHGPAETQRPSHLKSSRRTSELAPPSTPTPSSPPRSATHRLCCRVCCRARECCRVCAPASSPPCPESRPRYCPLHPSRPRVPDARRVPSAGVATNPRVATPRYDVPLPPPPSPPPSPPSPPSPPPPPPPQHASTCMAAVNVFVSGLQPDMLQRKEAVTPATAAMQTVVTRTRKEHAAALPTGKGTEGPREDGKREVVLRTVSLCAWACGWFSVRVCLCVCHSCGSCAFVCGVVAFPDGLQPTTRASRTI